MPQMKKRVIEMALNMLMGLIIGVLIQCFKTNVIPLSNIIYDFIIFNMDRHGIVGVARSHVLTCYWLVDSSHASLYVFYATAAVVTKRYVNKKAVPYITIMATSFLVLNIFALAGGIMSIGAGSSLAMLAAIVPESSSRMTYFHHMMYTVWHIIVISCVFICAYRKKLYTNTQMYRYSLLITILIIIIICIRCMEVYYRDVWPIVFQAPFAFVCIYMVTIGNGADISSKS